MYTKRIFQRLINNIKREQQKTGYISNILRSLMLNYHIDVYWNLACNEASKKYPNSPSQDKEYHKERIKKFIEKVEEKNVFM